MKKKMLVSAVAFWALASAANPPELKEGLWSAHTQSVASPGNKKSDETYTLCRNHAYDQSVQALAKSMKGCTTVSEGFQGGKYSADLHCVVAGTAIESKSTTTYQGDTSAHSESHAIYAPAMAGISEMTMIMDHKYLGSCPAGAQPGDQTNADGSVIHLGKH
jgi:hypothetical protein